MLFGNGDKLVNSIYTPVRHLCSPACRFGRCDFLPLLKYQSQLNKSNLQKQLYLRVFTLI